MPRWTNAILSNHAKSRLSERFEIDEANLLDQINHGDMGVKLGVSTESHLVHRLIWSDLDNDHIVLIQDVINGVILTVLTIEMYKRDYSDRVDEKKISRAINQFKNRSQKYLGKEKKKRLKVFCFFKPELGQPYFKPIGEWKKLPPNEQIVNLECDEDFWRWVDNALVKKGFLKNELLYITAGYSIMDRVRIERKIQQD